MISKEDEKNSCFCFPYLPSLGCCSSQERGVLTGEMGFPAGASVHASLRVHLSPPPRSSKRLREIQPCSGNTLGGFSLPTRPAAPAVLKAGTVGALLKASNWHQANFYLPPLVAGAVGLGKQNFLWMFYRVSKGFGA